MINSLLPLLLTPFMHSAEPAMMPMQEPPAIYMRERMPVMEDETIEPMTRADVSPMERAMMMKKFREQPMHVRRKGFEESSYWYRSARMRHATQTRSPMMKGTDLTQRTHRSITEWSRRTDRRMWDYPRGCEFPCAENTEE